MLLVKTYLDRSKIHGIGAFAAEPIKKGTKVWKFQKGFDPTITDKQMAKLPKVARDCIKHYAYYDRELRAYVMPGDNSRFINHSKRPNISSSEDSDYDTASRDIRKDEELTIDYSSFDSRHDFEKLYKEL